MIGILLILTDGPVKCQNCQLAHFKSNYQSLPTALLYCLFFW